MGTVLIVDMESASTAGGEKLSRAAPTADKVEAIKKMGARKVSSPGPIRRQELKDCSEDCCVCCGINAFFLGCLGW